MCGLFALIGNMKIVPMEVSMVDRMGSDLSVVNAARVSFAKESEWDYQDGKQSSSTLKQGDVRLINYLAKHNHWTPFAHAFASFRIKAPIFVARQLVKHQVGLAWNEVSRRYVDEEPEFWFPPKWRGRPINAKQGSSGEFEAEHDTFTTWLEVDTKSCLETYLRYLRDGVAPEQARMILPQNTMTEWIWSGSLAAFCRVCKLRLDPHAQLETQEVAGLIKGLLEPLFPVSFPALTENVE